MRLTRNLICFVVCAVCFACGGQAARAQDGQEVGVSSSTKATAKEEKKATAEEEKMVEPPDLTTGFLDVKWGMSYRDAKTVIEKSGNRPIGFKGVETELAWNGTFNGMEGRATLIFREGGGLTQMAVLVNAFDKQKDVFEAWSRKLVERHGDAKEEETGYAAERLWRLKNGFVIQLRSMKESQSGVVVAHWVKE